jgi:hypothetical protein
MWRRIEFVIIPMIGWMATVGMCSGKVYVSNSRYKSWLVTGTYTIWAISQLSPTNPNIIFLRQTAKWVVSFYSTALATNLIATGPFSLRQSAPTEAEYVIQVSSPSSSGSHNVMKQGLTAPAPADLWFTLSSSWSWSAEQCTRFQSSPCWSCIYWRRIAHTL